MKDVHEPRPMAHHLAHHRCRATSPICRHDSIEAISLAADTDGKPLSRQASNPAKFRFTIKSWRTQRNAKRLGHSPACRWATCRTVANPCGRHRRRRGGV